MTMHNLNFMIAPSMQDDAYKQIHPEIRIVAAIDFGTSHSGFAMAHVDDKVIATYTDWEDQPGASYPKNLTCIRYNPNGDVKSWGYSGRRSESFEDRVFEKFKLYLDPNFDKNKTHDLPPLPSDFIVKLVADYLRELYNFFLENHLRKTYGNMFDNKNILWILTVPAMWDERAKQLMTEAAVQAGIISHQDVNDKGRFNIVLEPEAAAMICCEISSQTNLKAGDNFIVIDAGGGTVDLTAYHVAKDASTGLESLKELCDGIGGCCGSTYVDDNFFRFVEEKCGSVAIAKYRENNPLSWFQHIVQPWESIKRRFRGPLSFKNDYREITVPRALRRLMSEEDIEKLEEDDGQLKISLDDITAMFDPVVEDVIELIEAQLSKCGNNHIDKMFLVGGFSCSNYLFDAIEGHFKGRLVDVQIVRPGNSGSAVVCGAVLLGLNPRFITARCARFTYGLRVSGLWTPENPAMEEEKFLNEYDGKMYATNLFHTMVVKGQQISIDDHVSERFVPTEVNQMHAKVEIYQTDLSSIKYIIPTMKRVGNLLVPISGSMDNQPYQMPIRINIVQDVSGSMGGTSIETCKDEIKRLCDILGPRDEIGVIEFSNSVNILSDISTFPITSQELPDYVDAMQIQGSTALYDAIYAGLRTLKSASTCRPDPYTKNILIVYTDGEENVSKIPFKVLSAALEQQNIPNFRFIFANAASENVNLCLLTLCRQDSCKDFCHIFPVKDSKEGITSAFKEIRRDIQVFRSQNPELTNKSVNLNMIFGESKIKAEATCPLTGQKRFCTFEFLAQKLQSKSR